MGTEKMKIEIWADIACPYCFIGKKKLENALQLFPHADQVELVWHSYELDPSLKKEPKDTSYLDFYKNEKDILDELYQLSEAVGIKFNFDRVVITSTADALRTVKFARNYHLAADTIEAFFQAYFTNGECISDRKVITEIAKKVGLPVDELVRTLDSNEYIAELTQDIRYSEDILILQYIPFYLFNNKTVIQGSIPDEVYLETLEKSFANWNVNGISTSEEKEFAFCYSPNASGLSCSIG
ncbi:DsbA family oxidoreductase [Proteiniphilum sp.]|jgi:predicted DsbA family dithiol-disulfide isomerase|uniref:DsbA family oxidoreductase n=1 Tax=Proteiniphilum sp. TaxID=1926877 RepID=UPI003328424B